MNIEARSRNMEQVPKEVLDLFEKISSRVLSTVKYSAWNEYQMRNWWRQRPLSEVFKNPRVNHLFPCSDVSRIATYFLHEEGVKDVHWLALTEKSALERFRKGGSRIMNMDGCASIDYEGRRYLLNIGCGDITLLWLNERRDDIGHEEKFYTTTRPEEAEDMWRRTDLIEVPADIFVSRLDLGLWDFVEAGLSIVPAHYGVTKNEFCGCHNREGRRDLMKENREMYDLVKWRTYEKKWREANKEFFPNLHPFVYEDK